MRRLGGCVLPHLPTSRRRGSGADAVRCRRRIARGVMRAMRCAYDPVVWHSMVRCDAVNNATIAANKQTGSARRCRPACCSSAASSSPAPSRRPQPGYPPPASGGSRGASRTPRPRISAHAPIAVPQLDCGAHTRTHPLHSAQVLAHRLAAPGADSKCHEPVSSSAFFRLGVRSPSFSSLTSNAC